MLRLNEKFEDVDNEEVYKFVTRNPQIVNKVNFINNCEDFNDNKSCECTLTWLIYINMLIGLRNECFMSSGWIP